MKFKLGKLPKLNASSLRRCSVDSLEAYDLIPTPIYIYMPKNEKFVCYKSPLDFFTTSDLTKLKTVGDVYLSPFVDLVHPFEDSARRIHAILSWNSSANDGNLAPTSYEVSDAVLRALAFLWAPLTKGSREILGIETFFAVVFANAFSPRFEGELIKSTRDADVDQYETAILRSGLAVFLALHLGYLDLQQLAAIRYRIFMQALRLEQSVPVMSFNSELEELSEWIIQFIPENEVEILTSDHFRDSPARIAQKLFHRLERVKNTLSKLDSELPSVFGTNGIVQKGDHHAA